MAAIYVLICPTTKRVRYVGATTRDKIRYRLQDHMWSRHNTNVSRWCFELKEKGLKPEIKLVMDREDGHQTWSMEFRLIREMCRYYPDLLNIAGNPKYGRNKKTMKYQLL